MLSGSALQGLGTTSTLCQRALQRYFGFGHCRDTLPWAMQGLRTAGILCCRALQEYSPVAVGHYCAVSCYWALQGYLVVARCRDALHLGSAGIRCHGHRRNTVGLVTAGIFCCRALQEYPPVAVTTVLLLGTAGILCRWCLGIAGTKILCGCALQGYVAIEHCKDAWWLGTARILCGWALQGYDARRLIDWALQGYFAVGYVADEHCRDTWWLGTAGILSGCGWALQGYSANGHCGDTLQLGIAGILCEWALQGYSVVGHCGDTLQLGIAGILGGWALRGYSAIGHCRDTWWLGITGILGGWALQAYSAIGHCKECTAEYGTAGILCGWALQGYSAVGPFRDALPFCTAVRLRAEGKDIIDLKSNNGNKVASTSSAVQAVLPYTLEQRLF